MVKYRMTMLYAVLCGLLCLPAASMGADTSQKVKVFIMAGQSNMEGHGLVTFGGSRLADYRRREFGEELIARKQEQVLDRLAGNRDKTDRYGHIIDKDGKWVVRDDVWVHYERGRGGLKKGGLSPGFGANDERIGPEFQFGHVMGKALENQVLLIKTCWGGKSLAVDFRPPSAGEPAFELKAGRDGKKPEVGKYYRLMMTQVADCLKNLKEHFADYNGQGFEIAGFVWFQGWNDGCNQTYCQEYEKNLRHLIADVRRDLGIKDLPVVIVGSGFGGHSETRDGVVGRVRTLLLPAQEAAAKSFDNAVYVDTRDCFRPHEESPGVGDVEHFFSNAETYFLIGDAAGRAMMKQLFEASAQDSPPDKGQLRILHKE